LSLATDVIVQADIHARELRLLIAWLLEYVESSGDRGKAPELHSTEPVRRAYLALGLLDKALGTKVRQSTTPSLRWTTRRDGFDSLRNPNTRVGIWLSTNV